jgi:hypothetical protein
MYGWECYACEEFYKVKIANSKQSTTNIAT